MSSVAFATQLAEYGPSAMRTRPTLAEAQAYCDRFTRAHYENFSVASWLLPREMRPHFCSIYAYCRWADDLADEADSPAHSLELLDWWESQLQACYAGVVTHPVFVALAETIREYNIPTAPFVDLLTAFRRDQFQTRYATEADLLDYCRCSANPVGRLVLHLGRCCNGETSRLSDHICTGLQLANFWQDVARDYDRGRIYLPQDACARHGYPEAMFAAHQANRAFRSLLAEQVAIARTHFEAGRPLVEKMPPALRVDIALFLAGGLAILRAIQRQDYDVWTRRPIVTKRQKAWLLAQAWWQTRSRGKVAAR